MRRCILLGEDDECSDFELCQPVLSWWTFRGRAHRLSADILSRFVCVNCADVRVSILPLAASLFCLSALAGVHNLAILAEEFLALNLFISILSEAKFILSQH